MSFDRTPPTTDLFADDLLAGETALVTGGGTGIRKELALAYADHGADVAIASRSMDHLEPVAAELKERGADACATTVDVRDVDDIETLVDTVLDELGDFSILVNNAGANFLCPVEDLSANGWRSVVGTILDGTANCTFAAGEYMIDRGGGAIVSMGATNSVRGAPTTPTRTRGRPTPQPHADRRGGVGAVRDPREHGRARRDPRRGRDGGDGRGDRLLVDG